MDKNIKLVFLNIIVLFSILIFFYAIISKNNDQLSVQSIIQSMINPVVYPIIHIIITRYKEPDISQLLSPFLDNKNIIIYIYNKGNDIPIGIPANAKNIHIIDIPNLGWDSYGYITHVINYYYKLPDYIFNLHASAQYLFNKQGTFFEIVEIINNIINGSNNNIFYYGGGIADQDLNFRLENWNATLDINRESINKYTESKIYPLENWIKSKIHKIPKKVLLPDNKILCSFLGQFIVHKSRILRYDISFYKSILEEISVWQSEVNHYLERSWYAFYGDDNETGMI
jgi:uncharacterized protein YggT (Ycf19 family)